MFITTSTQAAGRSTAASSILHRCAEPLQSTACASTSSPARPAAADGRQPTQPSAPRWLVEPFQSISLAELNAKADMLQRRDNKYVVPADILQRAVGELAQHFDVLEIDGRRDFTYDTCYFDDDARSCYFDHHRGRRIRCKVRMRKYVDAGLCFVEVKLKHMRGMTIKKRLERPVAMHGELDAEAIHFVRKSFGDLYGREFDRTLRRMIEMRYQRVTLVARDGGERLTIDVDMTFTGRQGQRTVGAGLYLLEAKSRNANGIADKILRRLHQHPTNSCSKYSVAMAALNEVHKYNKFLVALRRLGMLPADRWSQLAQTQSARPMLADGAGFNGRSLAVAG